LRSESPADQYGKQIFQNFAYVGTYEFDYWSMPGHGFDLNQKKDLFHICKYEVGYFLFQLNIIDLRQLQGHINTLGG